MGATDGRCMSGHPLSRTQPADVDGLDDVWADVRADHKLRWRKTARPVLTFSCARGSGGGLRVRHTGRPLAGWGRRVNAGPGAWRRDLPPDRHLRTKRRLCAAAALGAVCGAGLRLAPATERGLHRQSMHCVSACHGHAPCSARGGLVASWPLGLPRQRGERGLARGVSRRVLSGGGLHWGVVGRLLN
jgi:hypothetical protein